jgi:hypothetical protein
VVQAGEVDDEAFECLAFAAQILRALGVAPDLRILGQFDDFG